MEIQAIGQESLTFPVKDISLVQRACDPGQPLEPGDGRYKDFSVLRQGVGLSSFKNDLIQLPAKGRYHHRCLCGHRGSGKSTELLSLQQWADANGFLAARTEVDMHFGMIELEFADLFLLAATSVETAMQEFGQPLPPEKIRRVIAWFAEIIKEDKQTTHSEIATEAGGQLGGSLPLGLGNLFAKFTASVKSASEHATSARLKIRNYPDTLIDLTNDLLRTANERLAQHGKPRGCTKSYQADTCNLSPSLNCQ